MFTAYKLPSPQAPPKLKLEINTFLGCDLTNEAGNVDSTRSPDCINMIRDVPGKVRKRMGYYIAHNFALNGAAQKINGHFEMGNTSSEYIHAGNTLYKIIQDVDINGDITISSTAIYSKMADSRSKGFVYDSKLYITDGHELLMLNDDKVQPVSGNSRVPVFKIACTPSGNGKDYQSLNLLSSRYEQRYAGVATTKLYQLSLAPLSEDIPVLVHLLQKDGTWKELNQEGKTDFTVNCNTGAVSFVTAPGVSPIVGEDNIKICASRSAQVAKANADKINRCCFGVQYGVNGTPDRLFLSGNLDFPNYDWYSEFNDPTYFADLAYSVLGQSNSAIIGYSVLSSRLAAHKNGYDSQNNVIVREGAMLDSKASFRIVNVMQGEGAIASASFAYIANEPVFLTKLGVYAITAQDITGEKYSQCRSFYVNGALLKEDLENAFAYVYKDMYFLCFDSGNVYVLDGLQATQTDRSAPYSTRQYATFHLNNIYANVMWQSGNRLCFGTKNGEICCFCTDISDAKSYSDNGAPILARWQLPDIFGKTAYRNKSFSRIYMTLKSAVATGATVYAREGGVWDTIFSDYTSAKYFSFLQLCFTKLSFSGDFTPQTTGGKISIKRVDKAGFKLENKELNEPFGLNSVSVEFKETGYYKNR